ncbi:MAG: hypothetical protein QXS54_01025 [Candidatus Methanomethylicaceae archaeon]
MLAPEYAVRAQVDEIPENQRLLFYYPELDRLHDAGMKALHQIATQAEGSQKLAKIPKLH